MKENKSKIEKDVIGYDCDGQEIEEYRVLRAPFSEYIDDWSKVTDVDPRFYCAVKAYNDKYYLISIYDHWSTDEIRRYEHLQENEKIPTIIKNIAEAENYEPATIFGDGTPWYYEFSKDELVKKLNKIIMQMTKKEGTLGKDIESHVCEDNER